MFIMPDNLFRPLSLGAVTLSNRVCFLAHRTNFGRYGLLSDRHIAYYRRRARGGVGLIVVGELSIHPNDQPWESTIKAYAPDVVQGYRKLTTAVHEFETLIFAQLGHHGFQSSGAITRGEVWGPSATSDVVFGETCKAVETEDMETVSRAFARAAELARQGGFDGLEIDMGAESLLRQFLSGISNHRNDEYGGSLENRMRFPMEVLYAVRGAVGKDFPVGINLCADERFWGGITIDESLPVVQRIESEGLGDCITVSVGTYYNLHLVLPSMSTPAGFNVELAERIKGGTKLPVITSSHVSLPQEADRLISDGKADAVGFVRPLICDPDMVLKAREGRREEIRHCLRDNKGCIGRVNQSKALSCTMNPEVGYEEASGAHKSKPANGKKRVLVVGAGPAGLEAARVAAERGHDVTVFEQEKLPGGQVRLIVRRPGRQEMGGVVRYLKQTLERLRVPIITEVPMTAMLVEEFRPDAVIIATGSKPAPSPFPGSYGPPSVLNVPQVLSGDFPVGEQVLFIDENGGHHAAATAEYLADQGKRVHMVTSDLFIGIELCALGDLYLTRQRLLQKGVVFTSDVMVDEISGTTVRGRDIYTNKSILLEGYETVVVDAGNVAEDSLYRQLKGKVKELHRAGDCVAPRGIDMAILEGRQVGERV